MAEFAKYYIDFIMSLIRNIGKFFLGLFTPFKEIFTIDIPQYIKDLVNVSGQFGFWGWLIYVLMLLVNCTLVFFLLYRLGQLIRRFVFFRAKEVQKDQLMEELSEANETIAQLTVEKNQLYALKMNAAFPGSVNVPAVKEEKETPTEVTPVINQTPSRFSKLSKIDKIYAEMPPYFSVVESEKWQLEKIVDTFVNYSASQLKLYYNKEIVRCFFAGLAATKVIILEGISGTGKTSLPYAIGKFLNSDSTICSVQPSWRDRSDLLGYFNEFTKTFNETDFLAALYESTYKHDPSIIILDEMNLARIEYYFAEFLSIMEMPDTSEWRIDIVPSMIDGDPKNLHEGKILLPQSVWFVGTANQDDSTFTITDKVYDRTITLDLNERGQYFDAPITQSVNISADYLDLLFQQAMEQHPISDAALKKLLKLDDFIVSRFKITFANRILKQIKLFTPVFIACGGEEIDALDFLVKSKILRKLKPLNLAFLTKELNELIAFIDKTFGKNKMHRCIDFIKELLKTV